MSKENDMMTANVPYDGSKQNDNSKPAAEGDRFNTGKPELAYNLLGKEVQELEAKIWALGAKKYKRGNWLQGMSWVGSANSLIRHLTDFLNGEDLDEESKELLVGHIMCSAKILANSVLTRKDLDDREITQATKEDARKFLDSREAHPESVEVRNKRLIGDSGLPEEDKYINRSELPHRSLAMIKKINKALKYYEENSISLNFKESAKQDLIAIAALNEEDVARKILSDNHINIGADCIRADECSGD